MTKLARPTAVIPIIQSSDRSALGRLLNRTMAQDLAFGRRVRRIVDDVRQRGDRALTAYAQRFDGTKPPLELSPAEFRAALKQVSRETRTAIRRAARHIEQVARHQVPQGWRIRVARGVEIEQQVTPLSRVGCYVPGGRFPLPSSLLMTAIPARVAGVGDIIVTCPRIDPVVVAAAREAGVTRLFRIGGAHAIAAMAYGTASVPKVDKIVGPGNRWVAAAKAYVAPDCAIDFYAGPTEIVIVAGTGRPAWIAADLVAQAEHDPEVRAIFITWNRSLAQRVATEVERQAPKYVNAIDALTTHGAVVLTRSADEAMRLAERFAPEHLVVNTERLARHARAGAVFVGPFTAQAAGDYATGSNHVLPTAGAARFRGGLSAADFVRMQAVQRMTREGLVGLSPTILTLARAEGLFAHARSIEVRLP